MMPFWIIPTQVRKISMVILSAANPPVAPHVVVITSAKGQLLAILAVRHIQFIACRLDCYFVGS
jgi:hypothetical protein